MRKTLFVSLSVLLLASTLVSSAYAADTKGVNMKPKTPQDWRAYLRFRRDQVLEELYRFKPDAKRVIKEAQGYAVFVNFNLKILFVGSGNGRGLVHDNKSGKETFMRMLQAGVGLGAGVEDARMVFVFSSREAMDNFVNNGWSFSGDANASAKGGDSGSSTSGAIEVAPGVSVYRLVRNGLALDAMVKGTKYWVDADMNNK